MVLTSPEASRSLDVDVAVGINPSDTPTTLSGPKLVTEAELELERLRIDLRTIAVVIELVVAAGDRSPWLSRLPATS
jgi:hypothetical protein